MQVFTPYKEPILCAQVLDKKRLNKQIIECQQIIRAIEGNKSWHNHPVVRMYRPHKEWLKCYMRCLICFKDGNITMAKELDSFSMAERPSFLTDELCDQHKRRLFTKQPDKYPQFSHLGESEINWYVVDGEILKYKQGKRINELPIKS